MATTEAVLDHHLEALRAGDLEAVLADDDETSVLATPDATIRGLAGLRQFFEMAIELLPPGSQLEVTTRVVEGEFASIVWQLDSDRNRIPYGTDTFVVREGRITFQSFAGQIEPK